VADSTHFNIYCFLPNKQTKSFKQYTELITLDLYSIHKTSFLILSILTPVWNTNPRPSDIYSVLSAAKLHTSIFHSVHSPFSCLHLDLEKPVNQIRPVTSIFPKPNCSLRPGMARAPGQ